MHCVFSLEQKQRERSPLGYDLLQWLHASLADSNGVNANSFTGCSGNSMIAVLLSARCRNQWVCALTLYTRDLSNSSSTIVEPHYRSSSILVLCVLALCKSFVCLASCFQRLQVVDVIITCGAPHAHIHIYIYIGRDKAYRSQSWCGQNSTEGILVESNLPHTPFRNVYLFKDISVCSHVGIQFHWQ